MNSPARDRRQAGNALVGLVAALIVIAVIAGISIYVMQHQAAIHTTATANEAPAAGPSASIDQLTQNEAQAETRADTNSDAQIQQDTTSANSATSSVGGAYNEATL